MIMSKIILPIALACIFLVPINTLAESSKPVIKKQTPLSIKHISLWALTGLLPSLILRV
jgi:hypothetical protein